MVDAIRSRAAGSGVAPTVPPIPHIGGRIPPPFDAPAPPMRIAHVTTLHPPDDARIVVRECATLAAAGHKVHLVARGAGRLDDDAIVPAPIEVDEVRTGPRGLARRLRGALKAARAVGADLYHLHDPELLPLVLPLKAGGAAVVYDVHEDAPREVIAFGSSRALGRARSLAWIAAEAAAARIVDGIVAATPTIEHRFPRSKTVLARNFPVAAEVDAFAGPPLAERPPVALYVGGISTLRGAHELVAGIERVRVDGARLVLAGDFQPPELRAELSQLPGWERVDALGRLPRDGIAEQLRRARVGVVTLHPIAIHHDALPVKLFEYMAAGIPVVASDFPLWREIVQGAQCGVLVDPQDPAAVGEAIERCLADPAAAEEMGRRGRDAVQLRYAWEPEGQRLLALYARIRGR